MISVVRISGDNAKHADHWLQHIADNLRASDMDELKATSGMTPREALRLSHAVSTHTYVAFSDDEPILAFGAAPYALEGVGVAWLLGTEGIRKEALGVARLTKFYVSEMSETYPILWNQIDARNRVSMRWLEWGGFKIIADLPNHGPQGLLFHTFARSIYDV